MKITRQTPNEMVIYDDPLIFKLVGGFFSLIGTIGIIFPKTFGGAPPFWMMLAFILVGIFFVFTAEQTEATIDLFSGHIEIVRKSIVSAKKESIEISKIKELIVELSVGRKGEKFYYLTFILYDGRKARLAKSTDTRRQNKADIASRISKFANIPFSENI